MIIVIIGVLGVGKIMVLKELLNILLGDGRVKVFYFDDMELLNWDELDDLKKW